MEQVEKSHLYTTCTTDEKYKLTTDKKSMKNGIDLFESISTNDAEKQALIEKKSDGTFSGNSQ